MQSVTVLAKGVRTASGIHEGYGFLLTGIAIPRSVQVSVRGLERGISKKSVACPSVPVLHRILSGTPQLLPRQILSIRPTNVLQLQIEFQSLDKYIRRDLINPADCYDLRQGKFLLSVLAARQVALVQGFGKSLGERPDVFKGESAALAQRSEIVPKGDVT
jgi:hypothetical protein